MIGYVSGTVVYSDSQNSVILTASGVGYEVHTSTPMVPNRDTALFISHIIREQSQDLYGFETADDKKFFEMLLDVNGIGPKSAFGLVTHLGVQQIISAITFENVDILKSAPGVGKKSAEQIVLSLKDKINKLELGLAVKENPVKTGAKVKENKADAFLVKETLAACQGLGFKDQDVLPMIQRHLQEGLIQKPEEMVKIILKELR
ncbi:MAG: Holliday junction branch migration protein RuvA [Bacteriovoracaceae bacterium]|nr:Holliday junction branch migration protein RuvA [Bacteriovoracaceae bacterium]